MRLADRKASHARRQQAAAQHPQLVDLGPVPSMLGFDAWLVGPEEGGNVVIAPRLVENVPTRMRRLWRDLILASATGRCNRCGGVMGAAPGSGDAPPDFDRGELLHERDCPVGSYNLMPLAERYVVTDALALHPMGLMSIDAEAWPRIAAVQPEPLPPPLSTAPPHEPSEWLRREADKRLREVALLVRKGLRGMNVLVPLTEPTAAHGPARDEWERSCDRCQRQCQPSEQVLRFVHTGRVQRTWVMLNGRLCRSCGLSEYGQEPDGAAQWITGPEDAMGGGRG